MTEEPTKLEYSGPPPAEGEPESRVLHFDLSRPYDNRTLKFPNASGYFLSEEQYKDLMEMLAEWRARK